MRRRVHRTLTSVALTFALLLHGAALALTETESPSAHRDAVTASIPESGSLGLPAQRVPDLARPARDPQPTFRNRTDRALAGVVVAALEVGRDVAPSPPRRARSNPLRLRVHAADDPPH